MLLINSGLHDTEKRVARTLISIHELAKRLAGVQAAGTRVLWRGNNALAITHGLDVVSRHYMAAEGVPYVDTRAVMAHFEADIAGGCCSDHSLPGGLGAGAGMHIGAVCYGPAKSQTRRLRPLGWWQTGGCHARGATPMATGCCGASEPGL